MNEDAYTCACYLPQAGNVPRRGDILSWAESSAVVYANSVLGARYNRNSGIIELMGSIAGFVPEFGLLTDDSRRADWVVDVRTSKLPDAQLLGLAVVMKVQEKVLYVRGIDKWLGTRLDDAACAYLKDFGAACASNGLVGLYHIENLTLEAQDAGYDMMNCDNGTYDAWYWAHPPAYMLLNCNPSYVSHIKKFVDIPVVCAGHMTPQNGAEAVRTGQIDAVGVARQFLTEPAWVTKLMEGREEDIKSCICCHNACFTMARYEGSANDQNLMNTIHMARFALNPRIMQTKKYRIEKTGRLGGVFIPAAAPLTKKKTMS